MEAIISYTHNKQEEELIKLSKIINAIEQGNPEEFEKILMVQRKSEKIPLQTQP